MMNADERSETPSAQRGLTVERLAAGERDPLVVVDFLQLGSSQPLAEVLGAHNQGHPVYRIDPVTDLAAAGGTYRSLGSLADGYARACADEGLAGLPMAVVGFCSAAALSLLIAGLLAAQAPVSSILVQPTWPDARSIGADFASFRTDLGAGGDRSAEQATGSDAPQDAEASPRAALERMCDVLRRDLRALAKATGLDAAGPGLADLLARYQAWLGFALSSQDAAGRPWPREIRSCLVLGADAEAFIPWLDPGSYRLVRLAAPERGLLRDPSFADSVLACAWSWHGQHAEAE